jgi:hypothetical protein
MTDRWFLLAAVLALVAPPAAPAQPPVEPKDGKYTVPLAVDAVGPTRPALKHRLLPEPRELQSGNQVQAFYKCFFEQNHLFHNKESTDRQQKWNAAPLKDLAADKELVNYGGAAAKQAFYAARLDAVNWELTNQARSDGVGLLLPDVQQMRLLTGVLKVRARGELARGELDAATQTLQTMFALAHTFNDQPTLIGSLVGMALAMVALNEIEEFVQQPGAPNLFWPLLDLPTPFIDLRKGRDGDALFLTKEYDLLRKAVPAAAADLQAILKNMDAMGIGRSIDGKGTAERPSAYYARQAEDKDALASATERLKGFGHTADELAKLSPVQLAMMDDYAQYRANLDDFLRWTNVPSWQVPTDLGLPKRSGPFGDLLSYYPKVLHAKLRLQQVVAMLAAAEGVRAHAADHGGKLPAALDAVKLPLPADPVTGKPFLYELKDGKAIIRGTPPPGREKEPTFNRVYEVTVRR